MRRWERRRRQEALHRLVGLRRVLARGRALRALQRDGRDKLTGDYIFDRRYVISLVERVLAVVAELVLDATALLPEEAERFAEALERCRGAADPLLDELASLGRGPLALRGPGRLGESVEDRILAAVLRFMSGARGDGGGTVREVLHEIVDTVVASQLAGLEGASAPLSVPLDGPGGRPPLAVLPIDPAVLSRRRPSCIAQVRCAPLQALAARLTSADGARGFLCPSPWLALVGPEELSLRCWGAGSGLLLEATLAEEATADFLFLYWVAPPGARRWVPPRLHFERTGRGIVAWSQRELDGDLRGVLEALGPELLGPG